MLKLSILLSKLLNDMLIVRVSSSYLYMVTNEAWFGLHTWDLSVFERCLDCFADHCQPIHPFLMHSGVVPALCVLNHFFLATVLNKVPLFASLPTFVDVQSSIVPVCCFFI